MTPDDELTALRKENAELKRQLALCAEHADDYVVQADVERETVEAKLLLQAVLDIVPLHIVWQGMDGRIWGCNKHFALEAGFHTPQELIGRFVHELSDRAMGLVVSATGADGRDPPEFQQSMDVSYINRLGVETLVRKVTIPLRNSDGAVVGLLGCCEDITHFSVDELAMPHANMAKSQFLSSVSHEFHTPLNAIMGFAQLLSADQRTPLTPNQRESLDLIVDSGHQLHALIEEILELAKIEAGHIVFKPERLELVEVLYETLPMVQAEAERKGVEINIPAIEHDVPRMVADLQRLKQVFHTLLLNAVKNNVEGGSVTVDAFREDEYVIITIEDTGIGISPERLKTLFTPFSNDGQSDDTGVEGTGIGLVIAEDLLRLMGGEIDVRSELGKGTTYSVLLPVAPIA